MKAAVQESTPNRLDVALGLRIRQRRKSLGVSQTALADAIGRPVRRHTVREATAYGAAMAAGLGAGLLNEAALAERATYEQIVEPKISPDEAEARYRVWAGRVF